MKVLRFYILITLIFLKLPLADCVTLKGLLTAPFVRTPSANCKIALGHLRKFQQRHWGPQEKIAFAVQKMKEAKKRSIKEDPISSKFLEDNKVYLSITTSPSRISEVIHTLNTLDLENVEKVFLTLPQRFSRTQETYDIPKELLNFPKLEILRVDEDLGPATKLIPAYEKLQQDKANGILITIDDDVAYAYSLVNEMIYAAAHNPNAVHSGSSVPYANYGVTHKNAKRKETIKLPDGSRIKENDIVKGVSAIAYPLNLPKAFSEEVRSYARMSPAAFHSDDLTISAALEFFEIPRYQIDNELYSEHHNIPLPHSRDSDALHIIAPVGVGQKKGHDTNYQKAMELILQAWKKRKEETDEP